MCHFTVRLCKSNLQKEKDVGLVLSPTDGPFPSSEFRSLTCSLDWWVTAGSVSLLLGPIQWDLITLQRVSLNGCTEVWQGHELNMRPANTQTKYVPTRAQVAEISLSRWDNKTQRIIQLRLLATVHVCEDKTQTWCQKWIASALGCFINSILTANNASEIDTVVQSAPTCSHQQCSCIWKSLHLWLLALFVCMLMRWWHWCWYKTKKLHKCFKSIHHLLLSEFT